MSSSVQCIWLTRLLLSVLIFSCVTCVCRIPRRFSCPVCPLLPVCWAGDWGQTGGYRGPSHANLHKAIIRNQHYFYIKTWYAQYKTLTVNNKLGSVQSNIVQELKRTHRITGPKLHGHIYVFLWTVTCEINETKWNEEIWAIICLGIRS